MRLDMFLKVSRLAIRRSVAQTLCSKGFVAVNDVEARPSKEIKEGDIIRLSLPNSIKTVKVNRIPETKQVSKNAAVELYEIITEQNQPDINSISDQ